MLKNKDTPFEHLQNEITREKISAVSRIAEILSNCLTDLEMLDEKINKAIAENHSCQDINKMIETFNNLRDSAEEWRYYFIVTRESSNFFHSYLKAPVYKIPPRKQPI
jgi:hypothetical protein